MIEESLLKSNFIGKDGFIWWIGQVADPKVWRKKEVDTNTTNNKDSWGYRCKVRIIGYHSFDPNILKDEDLPWAHILTSAAEGAPAQGGFGKLPSIVGGESVVGFFLDGDEAQQPVVMACFHRSPAVVNVPKGNPFDPFTGSKGPFASGSKLQLTRNKAQEDGKVKEIPQSIGDGSQFTMGANSEFGVDTEGSLDLSPGFTPISPNTSGNAGALFGLPNTPQDLLYSDDKGELGMLAAAQGTYVPDNGCSNNIIGQIQAALQSFIKLINGLEQTALGFIDPIRNVVVNVQQSIRKVARLIASIMKFVINGVRDNIFKLVGKLFKLLAITLPSSIKLPISEAAKNILNIIFCIFEKLFGPLMDFIMGLLNGLIGKTPSIPQCATEETIAALVAKLADMIDGVLGSILGGLDWLASGISQIAGTITGALNFVSQILSFLSCDALACKGVKEWDPFGGIKLPKTDKWAQTLNNIDILGGLGDDIDSAIGFLSMFGSADTPFKDCRSTAINPKTQEDIPDGGLGLQYFKCIPPEIIINGDGIDGKAIAVVSPQDGSILTIKVLNPGKGYTSPPTINILDKSNYGKGAFAKSEITDTGSIKSIYLTEPGKGYCATNLSGIGSTVGIGTTTGTGTGTGIGATNPGISTTPVGIITDFAIIGPGLGYTGGDTIEAGGCVYEPILTANGSIIGVISPNACKQQFLSYPTLSINTNTGEGAVLYPVVEYVPQYIIDNANLLVGITSIVSIVDCPGEPRKTIKSIKEVVNFELPLVVETNSSSSSSDNQSTSSTTQTTTQTQTTTTTTSPDPTPTPTPTPTPPSGGGSSGGGSSGGGSSGGGSSGGGSSGGGSSGGSSGGGSSGGGSSGGGSSGGGGYGY